MGPGTLARKGGRAGAVTTRDVPRLLLAQAEVIMEEELTANRRGEIVQRLKRIVGQHPARITAFPICEKDIRLVTEVITAGYVVGR